MTRTTSGINNINVRPQVTVTKYKPQSTYRGRGETGGVFMPSQMERIPQLVMVDRVKGGGQWACTPTLTSLG
jgi:hypothetical protein